MFWQDSLSVQQSALVSAVARSIERTVLVAPGGVSAERRALGWRAPDFGAAAVHVAPDARLLHDLVDEDPDATVHLFTGWKPLPFRVNPMQLVHAAGARFGFQAEIPTLFEGFRTAKSLRDRIKCLWMGSSVGFVLAMGKIGVRWYQSIGFPGSKVFDFGYFVDMEAAPAAISENQADPFRITFVGQLIDRKGVDVLIAALAQVPGRDWRCDLFGDGPRRDELAAQAERGGLGGRLVFRGARDRAEVVAAVAQSDLLVLPSRWDGWGIVVNEALAHGVPAICTDRCGAQDLLAGAERGEVVPAESVAALASALARRMASGRPDQGQRRAIAAWAERISGASAADYLLDILDHVYNAGTRPQPPWA